MSKHDDKRLIRTIKKAVKRQGNKHRRYELKRHLADNPDEAHLAEENLGGRSSAHFNGLNRPVDGSNP